MTQAASLHSQAQKQGWIEKIRQRPVPVFLLSWLLLNLVQVSFMELTSDEGYYWFYAQRLQWGYYDHPPLVALLIRAGTAMIPGELGVRFFNVLLSTGGLALFFTLLPHELKQKRATYLVLLSAPLLHYLTFIIFPDGPLLTFSLLFLVVYKRFLAKQDALTAILLGVSLSLMAYAKYHGALVLLFTVLANPKLLRSGYFYLALLVALLLFTPHLWWQYREGFPTLHYHLSGRTGQWGFRHVGEYLSQQVVAIGPGLIFIPFVSRAKDLFERTLLFIITGTFLFFLFSSLKTFVHFHWTSVALYPLLYFAVQYYNRPEKGGLFRWLILPFVGIFLLARLLLMVPLIPNMHAGEDWYHGREQWAVEVAALAGGRPVFMPNNLREASLYRYYAGGQGVTLYTRTEKRSQYELWGYEDSLQGKEVLFVNKHPFEGAKEAVLSTGHRLWYSPIPHFQSYYNGISLQVSPVAAAPTDSVQRFRLTLTNNRKTPVLFSNPDGSPARLVYNIEKGKQLVGEGLLPHFAPTDSLAPGASLRKEVMVPLKDLPSGTYSIVFGIRAGVLPDAMLVPFALTKE